MKLRHALLPALLALASVAATAQNQFDGTWILNQSKSQLAGDLMHFSPAGDGMIKYTDSEETYTFKADGTSFSTPTGAERTIKKIDDQTFETTTKRHGNLIESATWTLGNNGKTLTIVAKGTKGNGDSFEDNLVYERMSGSKGLIGTWKSNDVKLSSPNSLTIASEGLDGVVLSLVAEKATCTAKWDGKDYTASGPTIPEGLTLAVSKTGSHSFKLVEKLNGKVVVIERYTVSADGNSMVGKGTNGKGTEPYTEVWDKQA